MRLHTYILSIIMPKPRSKDTWSSIKSFC